MAQGLFSDPVSEKEGTGQGMSPVVIGLALITSMAWKFQNWERCIPFENNSVSSKCYYQGGWLNPPECLC